MLVTVCNMMSGEDDIVVHKTGCCHIAMTNNRLNNSWDVEATTQQEVVQDAWADQIAEGSMTLRDGFDCVRFAPCTKGLTEGR